ncbi:rhodanese-like domain-containing protein [Reinekea blandensis]|uniref:Rhodanese domain-containing protein n=1 Tax=Reinekea blandensis MED297 TaxID=314283 RepID=A4B9K7_9GAMM|nr:rhodanese-like domain-containing protein [Reinekea blandensis]EAR11308.1 hypothetical protein MED297_20512 [Reinekea sp. MED297] [Reinekea blandensis MED297]
MNRFFLVIASLFIFAACTQAEPDLSVWLEDGVIIDTRSVMEFESGHVADAIVMPHDTIDQTIASVAPDKSTPIILYCRSGNRAGIAKSVLNDMGYENVVNLGGLQEAQAAIDAAR